MSTPKPVHFVAFADGSCVPNPGLGGYGVYGYLFHDSDRPKNIKHPAYSNLYFTSQGITAVKEERSIEVTTIVEVVKAINNPTSTNNEAELLAILTVFRKAVEIEHLSTLTVYTDSNYAVSAFNENLEKWKLNDWRRGDNKPVAHLTEWTLIDGYKKSFEDAGVQVRLVWVKGHSNEHGNEMADLFSVIGSNSTKRQLNYPALEFQETLLDSMLSYRDYKQSYLTKDIVFFFRDLYFTSSPIDDKHYCFLSTSENPNTLGKRDTSSIFVTNIGYVPPLVNRLKEVYRETSQGRTTTCCIKLSKFDNKELYRLAHLLDVRDLLIEHKDRSRTTYKLVRDTTPFMFENTVEYPFIVNAAKLFNGMLDVSQIQPGDPEVLVRDITERIVVDGKIVFSNRDKTLDFTDTVSDGVALKQKLLVTVGSDIPSYLALKNLEAQIQRVELVLHCKSDSNFCTLYINIHTSDRNLYSVNIENKFLRSLSRPLTLQAAA